VDDFFAVCGILKEGLRERGTDPPAKGIQFVIAKGIQFVIIIPFFCCVWDFERGLSGEKEERPERMELREDVCCSVLQCVVVCCSVLQRVVVCCEM